MDLAHDLLVFLHFLGLGSLFGGLFVQLRSVPRVVNNAVLHGVLTQVVTGILLVGLLESGDGSVNHPKIGVKLAVALVIAGLAVARRKATSLGDGAFFSLLGLTTLNIAVAVFWH